MLSPDLDPSTDVRRLASALRTAIRVSGVSHRRIEREIGLSTGYLTRILAGQIQLRMAHVLSICHVIGLPAGSFFAAMYPLKPPASEAEARLARILAQLHQEPVQLQSPENLLTKLADFLEELRGEKK